MPARRGHCGHRWGAAAGFQKRRVHGGVREVQAGAGKMRWAAWPRFGSCHLKTQVLHGHSGKGWAQPFPPPTLSRSNVTLTGERNEGNKGGVAESRSHINDLDGRLNKSHGGWKSRIKMPAGVGNGAGAPPACGRHPLQCAHVAQKPFL